MFEPFFSTKVDGMGMGLNICRSIIESHHGRLWASNVMDSERTKLAGCTFTMLLPLESSDSVENG
jgi:signal transduction histidine kinase